MKTKYYLYGLLAAAMTLTGCDYNEEHFPGFDELAQPKDVRNDTLVLSDADYKTIAGMKANMDLALSKDPEGGTYQAALEAVAANKYFTEDAPAVWYLPAYIANKFPYLDDNSKVTVLHKSYENLPEYLKDFRRVKAYELKSDDYKVIWGEDISVSFVSPSTLSKISAVLKENVEKPVDGEMRLVNYAYSETEPSFGGGGEEPGVSYTDIAEVTAGNDYVVKGEVIATYGRGFLLGDKSGSVLVYLNKAANYSVGDVVTVSGTASSYSGFPQFPASSVVELVERSETFAYPAAVSMSGADMDAWTKNAEVKYVSITGKLSISGNYYNLTVEGATRQGSISYPVGGLVDEALNGQEVTVTGYLIGYSSKFVNMMATSVVAAGAQSEYTPVGVIALSKAGDYKAKGTVAAIYSRGFLLNDGTGSVLVYLNKAPEVVVGDIVTVSGKTTAYAGFNQFPADTSVEKVGKTTFNYPDTRILVGADMDAYLELPYIAYVSYEGTLSISGYYYNVAIDGAETAMGSISYVPEGMVDPELNGKKVVVTGYTIGVSGGKYVNTMAVKVEEATAATAKTRMASTRASVQPNASAVYRYSASSESWSKYSTDEAEVAVLQPSDYDKMGYSYISKPAETLPVYLNLAYPYAKADDVVAVVYYSDKDASIATTEFKYDGAAWTETTVAAPAVITFQKANGEWVEARVYFESTLLNGESGGFVPELIEDAGLSAIWTLENSYGWKGAGYANGANNATESYLVSPEIDLGKAVAPSLVFDVAINFLKGNDRAEYFNIVVSDAYAGNAASTDWKKLEVSGWPEGTSWTFSTVEPISMANYVGKKIRIAFHYKTTEACAPTVEVKNISIKE